MATKTNIPKAFNGNKAFIDTLNRLNTETDEMLELVHSTPKERIYTPHEIYRYNKYFSEGLDVFIYAGILAGTVGTIFCAYDLPGWISILIGLTIQLSSLFLGWCLLESIEKFTDQPDKISD